MKPFYFSYHYGTPLLLAPNCEGARLVQLEYWLDYSVDNQETWDRFLAGSIDFPSSRRSRMTLGATRSHSQWFLWLSIYSMKLTTHLHPVKVKKFWNSTSIFSYNFMPWCLSRGRTLPFPFTMFQLYCYRHYWIFISPSLPLAPIL